MPPMERQTPDPLKQMRRKQATRAHLLAAQNKQRVETLKGQEIIRAVEAAEKLANAERLKTPLSSEGTIGTRTQPNPTQNSTLDPEILREAGDTTARANTP